MACIRMDCIRLADGSLGREERGHHTPGAAGGGECRPTAAPGVPSRCETDSPAAGRFLGLVGLGQTVEISVRTRGTLTMQVKARNIV
eukprot:SAG31_NODE_15596_length_747_cov_1.407407_1_plen_86_part_10